MQRIFTLLSCLLFTAHLAGAQATISGKITDTKEVPVSGASVSLDNTLDGGTTDSAGNFRFITTETGAQVLAITAVGFEAGTMPVTISGNVTDLTVKLKSSATRMEGVTVTAGF